MGVEKLQCYFDAAKPTDVLLCFSVSEGVLVWNIVFIGILLINIIGWGIGLRRFEFGMMVGGFLSLLIGIPLFALGLINIQIWMVSTVLTLAGLVVAAIRESSND